MTDLLETLDEQDRLREAVGDYFPWSLDNDDDPCGDVYTDTLGDLVFLSDDKKDGKFILHAVNNSAAIAKECRRLTAENELLRGQVKSLTAAVLEGKPDPVEAFRRLREISGDHWDNVDVDEFMREMRED